MIGLEQGDVIVHPEREICRIKKISSQRIVIRPCFNNETNLTLFIPRENIDQIGIRSVKSKKIVLDALEKFDMRIRVQKLEHSEQKLQEWFAEGKLEKLTRATVELYKKIYVDEDSRVSQRKLMEKAIDFLAEEFAVVEETSKQEASKRILNRLGSTFGFKESKD